MTRDENGNPFLTADEGEFLQRVRSRLVTGYTDGASARDIHGKSVLSKDPSAVCWCLLGAIEAESSGDVEFDNLIRYALRTQLQEEFLAVYSDTAGQAQLLASLDRILGMYPSTS
jgi:hypothetical protein